MKFGPANKKIDNDNDMSIYVLIMLTIVVFHFHFISSEFEYFRVDKCLFFQTLR